MKRIYYKMICTENGNQSQHHGDVIYSYEFCEMSLNMPSLYLHQ